MLVCVCVRVCAGATWVRRRSGGGREEEGRVENNSSPNQPSVTSLANSKPPPPSPCTRRRHVERHGLLGARAGVHEQANKGSLPRTVGCGWGAWAWAWAWAGWACGTGWVGSCWRAWGREACQSPGVLLVGMAANQAWGHVCAQAHARSSPSAWGHTYPLGKGSNSGDGGGSEVHGWRGWD